MMTRLKDRAKVACWGRDALVNDVGELIAEKVYQNRWRFYCLSSLLKESMFLGAI